MRLPASRAWCWTLAASVALIGIADAIVLELAHSYFGSGYNVVALHGLGQIAAFFAAGATLDLAAVATVWCLTLVAARVVRARPLRTLAAATLLGVALPLGFDLVLHRLHRVLGDVLELGLLLDLAAGSWRNAVGEAAQDLPSLTLLGAASALIVIAGFSAIVRLERASARFADVRLPRARWVAALASVSAAAGISAIAWAGLFAPALDFGWGEKPAGRALRAIVSAGTDVDRDGYGWLSRPGDPAPLDSSIHPFAVEIPGNGIDENGVGGDLPESVAVPEPLTVPAPRPRPGSPSVVLIFLESFRADLVGMRTGDREVTPNLNRLAAGGTHRTAYAHVPVTWESRGSLLQGRVVPTPDGDTLVDDFLARGYEVAWFSGQHDGLAVEDARLGTERATYFYDARDDVARRTSRSAQPISLQVSWKTVVGRVEDYLAKRESEAPLFLYVNIVDTHFPYWHRELDDVFEGSQLPRDAIRPENRERVWRAYLNAAANVDRAIGRIVGLAQDQLGASTMVVVTGDHGQSFYENGLLGHGQSLDDAQTAVPLVVGAREARLPEPVAVSDLRGLVGHWLDGTAPAEAELARSEIFQHVGALEQPTFVGLRDRTGVCAASAFAARATGDEACARAVHVWETLDRDARNEKRRRP
jgi:hypothetical protein